MNINGIVLAAGLSSRMKVFKPFLKLNGKTIIENSIDSMFSSGVKKVIVVLGYRGNEVEEFLKDKYDPLRIVFTYNHKYLETDMLTSIKIGISALGNCDAFYILPGDMPVINTTTFIKVKEDMIKTNAMIAFPTINGYRKHPPLISKDLINYIINFNSNDGLRGLWKLFDDKIVNVAVDDLGCIMDADTKEDYNKLIDYIKEEKIS